MGAAEQPPITKDSGLHKLIDRLEKDFRRGNLILIGTILYISILPLLSALYFLLVWLTSQPGYISPIGTMFLPLCIFLVFYFPWLAGSIQRNRIRKQLEGSHILACILSGVDPAYDIRQSVPGLLRHNLDYPQIPKGYPGGLAEQLWNMGYYLDWYLHPARILIRPAWFAGAGLLIFTVVLISRMLGLPYLGIFEDQVFAIVFSCLSLLFISIVVHDLIRKHMWTRLLVEHLRELVG